MTHHPDSHEEASSNSRFKWILMSFIVVAAFFLFTEHQAHILGALPYLILLACPLMHFFMHRGHGHSHGADKAHDDRAMGAK